MVVKNLYLDESGNTGDLISRKNGLSFAAQPVFSLAAVDIAKIANLEEKIEALKSKFHVKSEEIKSSDLYKKKPSFILEVFSILVESKSAFFVEVVDKRFYVATSITNSQIFPPYFTGDESDGRIQVERIISANAMALEMSDTHFDHFFEVCHDPIEEKLLKSMTGIREFFSTHSVYSHVAKNLDNSVSGYFYQKEVTGVEAVSQFVPIPDRGKRGNKILLLPHVTCLTNIIARVNLANQGDIKGVKFLHDKQDHFDEALIAIKEMMADYGPDLKSPPTPNSNFNIKTNADLEFSDSKKNIGIQIADLLAGFFSRYYYEFFKSGFEIGSLYHEIYKKILDGCDPAISVGINWVVPPSRLYELECYHQIGIRRFPHPHELHHYVAIDFGLA